MTPLSLRRNFISAEEFQKPEIISLLPQLLQGDQSTLLNLRLKNTRLGGCNSKVRWKETCISSPLYYVLAKKEMLEYCMPSTELKRTYGKFKIENGFISKFQGLTFLRKQKIVQNWAVIVLLFFLFFSFISFCRSWVFVVVLCRCLRSSEDQIYKFHHETKINYFNPLINWYTSQKQSIFLSENT